MKIALIEEPKSCASCPLFDVGYAFDMCRLSKKQVTTMESISIPKWCELKPLPQKGFGDADDIEQTSYFDGWNDCIDAITGETE